ncbi:activating signal cointegrator 1 complex subunit 2 homolog [Anopheles maculipalpis]|uniref:activating signal cointegrator 1 complex subunit 2 homolog n=1 Tax=Anopheles maculipalpis TaxID=1496333 RepID=UPI002158B5B2|nr:activating signal cointegrator 1 complex subunit 2 homolog [Anopheles maculipalpis]
MNQNSKKPTTTNTPSKGNRPSMQHGHQHHQQTSMIHQQQMQPGSVVYQQQQQPLYSTPQYHQQPGCIVLPSSTPMPHHHQPHQTYMPQQPGQLVNVATAETPMYVGGTVMGHQTAQQASPAGFSTSAQQQTPPPVRYLQTVQQHPSMSPQQVQRPNYQPTTVTDFVAGSSAGPAVGFSGAHQPYKQQPHHQHQAQPMQSYQEAPTPSYPVHVQSSLHPEGPTTTEAQYFFDANCTMPVVQQQNPATLTGCRNPSCTSCKSFKRN